MATPKQELFVQEYLIDLNATQAAIRAGYSTKTAYSIGQENLKKPEIMSSIEAGMEERASKTKSTSEKVLADLEIIKNRCMQIEEVFDSSGQPIGVYKFHAQGALKALELIGKHLGMYNGQGEEKEPVETNFTIQFVSPNDKLKD